MRYLTIFKAVKYSKPHAPYGLSMDARVSKDRNTHGRARGHPLRRPHCGLLRVRSELLYALLALMVLLALGIGAARAHAFLDHADPRVGNTVKSSPRIISLWFTQNLESAFSTIDVLDSNGTRMNAGNAVVSGSDRKLLRVPVKVLPAGTYTVKWRVLSVDTHTTEGNFTFRVGP